MNSTDFKKLLDESLKPIRKDLEELKRGHGELKHTVGELKHTVGELKHTVEKKILPSVTYIEVNIKAYKDSYQINNANSKKLEKRVEVLEEKVGVIPPPELTLAEVS